MISTMQVSSIETKTLDVETYSEAGYVWSSVKSYTPSGLIKPGWIIVQKSKNSGLACVGAYAYAEHPSTEILSLDFEGELWKAGDPPPQNYINWIQSGGLVDAHNSFFEYVIMRFVATRKMGWPLLPIGQLRCTASRCRSWGLPGSLENAGRALNLTIQKDMEGHAAMLKVSKPRDPTQKDSRVRYTPADAPELFAKLYPYNQTDTAAERLLGGALPQLTAFELEVWKLDQRINERGICVDIEAVNGGIKIIQQLETQKTAELAAVTGGVVTTGGQTDRMHAFLRAQGVVLPNMQKKTVAAALDDKRLQGKARQVLQLRQDLALASVKKLFSMHNRVASDGRLHDLFVYGGAARTLRWSSEAVQLHNLAKAGPDLMICSSCGNYQMPYFGCKICGTLKGLAAVDWCAEAAAQCIETIKQGSLPALVERWGGDAAFAISGSIRAMLIAGPGSDFIGTDYDSIEARILAQIAGEEWRLEVFRTHGNIYEMSLAHMSGIAYAEIMEHKERTGHHHPLRKVSKVRELASGYQGAVAAYKRFGAGDYYDSDEAILADVKEWREKSPAIVALWRACEERTAAAVAEPDTWKPYREIAYYYAQAHDVLYCRLPSGRLLPYHKPRLAPNDWGRLAVTYTGQDQESGAWCRVDGYGGMYTAHIVQGAARDILAWAMLQLDAQGYPVVLHVHDEPVAEVPEGTGSVEAVERILGILPPWAAHWPITATGGWRGKKFRKD